MQNASHETQAREIHARLELTDQDGGFVTCNIEVTENTESPSRILAAFIGRHLQEFVRMAEREHKELAKARAEAQPAQVVAASGPRIAGPDGKPLN